ncbi:Flagellin FlaB1 [Methanosarcina horonobensis HB-1 = JCM 15518]|uniref:Flagellin n=1 Tax=Methanosarcina horonobensis HB-1 = JCM 15518 TaxID=1434110 RepID=A0A0E3SA45_9EURY|nr:archaellin/type IV pilin N-terminal domain-containing protein [Methanosarcina horonobensis]AKB77641.1 Flagellin FlaB1 [Methanosarcina horonobensis HB-1 = JCM 15518]
MWKIFSKDEKGFTGLEAAIVLVAFVVVAAVFSYVMLGAGFYTTQKSQEVVHTGVAQASSSVELSGDLVATGDLTAGSECLDIVTLCLQPTAGGSAVDMATTLITVTTPNHAPTDLKLPAGATYAAATAGPSTVVPSATEFGIANIYNDNGNSNLLLERGEKFEVTVDMNLVDTVGANEGFQLEIKPPQGASYTIHRTAPPAISALMTLV